MKYYISLASIIISPNYIYFIHLEKHGIMKSYKLILIAIIILLLIIFVGVFAWLWKNNSKNMNPLPIMTSDQNQTIEDEDAEAVDIIANILFIQAETSVQPALDDLIKSFTSRYAHTDILTHYVSSNELLSLPKRSLNDDTPSPSILSVDMIIAHDKLSTERLLPLQKLLEKDNDTSNSDEADTFPVVTIKEATDEIAIKSKTNSDNVNTRQLNAFTYALKDKQAADGVILTENPTAVSFRNFMLSTTGQDILKKYRFDNIEGYKNSVGDLFNTGTKPKSSNSGEPEDVIKAITNTN